MWWLHRCVGLTFISNSILKGEWSGRDENEKMTQHNQEIPQVVALVLSIWGQCRAPTVCGWIPRGQEISALQFQSRVAA